MAIFQVTNIISTLEKLPLKNGYIYYIANLDNLSDIMSHGISAISTDPKRSHAEPIYGKAISEYVSLYFNPRNATLYSAQKSYGSKVIILQIHKTALLADGVIFTNASATATRYECANELSDLLNTQFISWSEVMSKGWNHVNKSIEQSKRDRMMAEALVPTHLPIDMIAGIICQDSSIAKSIASDYSITAVADMEYFFPIKLYAPQSKDELKGLIYDEDIYLGDIDTSAITDMSELFYESEREDFSGIESWDVSSVTDMSGMFTFCYNFNQPLNNWDVSSVTDMSEMFAGCTNFNQPLDNWLINNPNADKIIDKIYGYGTFEKARATIKPINGKYHPKYKWQLKLLTLDNSVNLGDIDTSAITDMSELFDRSGRKDFSGIDSWDVSSVTDMSGMFCFCENFNQPLDSWDVSSVTNMSGMFCFCENFNQPLDNWDVSSVTNMSEMFAGCYNFNQPLNNWNVGSVTDMSGMFRDCDNFNQPLNNWDVSSVTDMSAMFIHCYNFNQPLNNWNVSSVTDMSVMFSSCENFNQPLNNWNVSSVTDMGGMFGGCTNFNQSLNNWNVSSVTDMGEMFVFCENFNQPLNNWDVSSVTNMREMFRNCENFNQPLDSWRDKLSQELINKLLLIYFVERKIVNNKTRYYPKTKDELRSLVIEESLNLGDIDTSAITDMSGLFYGSGRKDFSGIESWDVSSVTCMSMMFFGCDNFNQPLDSWDVGNVTNMSGMFRDCTNFNQPLNNWNVSSVTNMREMFRSCENFNQPLDSWRDKLSQKWIDQLPLRCFVERKIVNNKTRYYPKTRDELESLVRVESLNLGDIDTSAITDMSWLFFYNWRKDFSGIESWDVSSVTNMSRMFVGCKNFNQPLNNWDVSSVTDMNGVFADCENFNQPLDNWNVSSATNMRAMFADCKNFNQPLDNWDVSSVTDMSVMFAGCENFNQPLNNWDVSSVTNMSGMFADCDNFNQPLDNWDVSSVTDMGRMFGGCKNFNQPLDNWNVSSVTDMRAMFDGCKINDENKPKF